MNKNIVDALEFITIPKLKDWKPDDKDIIFTNTKNVIIAPIDNILGLVGTEHADDLNYFIVKSKKCYNSQELRQHACLYLNYLEAYFDKDHEILVTIAKIKYMIDIWKNYNYDTFLDDIRKYILNNSIKYKVMELIEHNYELNLTYKNITASLQYSDTHAKYLLNMSIMADIIIILTTHYAHKKHMTNINDILLDVYDMILYSYPVDMYAKLYETAISNTTKSEYKNAPLWSKQGIRGKDALTHSMDSIENIILNIMPKYSTEGNVVA